MKHHLFSSFAPLLTVAALSLAGCGQKTEAINETVGDPQAADLANAAPVELPPMLKASHSYRCKDNSLVFIDFMTDDKSVNFRTEKGGAVTPLKAPEAGQPFVSADGATKVEGTGDSVTVTYGGKGAQSCKD